MSLDQTFIETQFPVSKLSKESYKERKANYSQTLTGLGKWWGRKPLVMVRAAILGLLMPATCDPRKDREIFLKILTMDDAGLLRRKSKNIGLREVYERMTPEERDEYFGRGVDPERPRFRKGLSRDMKERAQALVFGKMTYDEKLDYCDRPEQIEGPSAEAWMDINAHLGTEARNLPELVAQLGKIRFGHVPRVGDAFCGGGSVPFEAARIGCEAYGSDLNPVAALLTWGALHIVGGGEEVARRVREAQQQVFAVVDRQITEWGIEHNEDGWRADAYLYCTETCCPECGWSVPLAPSWVIGEKTRTVAKLVPNHHERRFDIEIHRVADADDLIEAKRTGTVRDSRLHCPNRCESTSIGTIRSSRRGADSSQGGLRLWENEDVVPRPEDVFQERLYCIRWVLPALDEVLAEEQRLRNEDSTTEQANQVERMIQGLMPFLTAKEQSELAKLRARDWWAEDAEVAAAAAELEEAANNPDSPKAQVKELKERWRLLNEPVTARRGRVAELSARIPNRLYRGVRQADLEREAKVLDLLRERFTEWQAKGYIPSRRIEPGDKTDEPIRTRGWTHWQHLFTPRQLLLIGLLMTTVDEQSRDHLINKVTVLLAVDRCLNFNSRLTRWVNNAANEKGADTFSNQALNALYVYITRPLQTLDTIIKYESEAYDCHSSTVHVMDCRENTFVVDCWVTDPPYADAINYHELSEFFLAWYEKHLPKLFPDWYADSKRALAIRGSGKEFRQGMVDAYGNLARHMPDNGLQIVMFTHQDAGVWADLALILWAAGLRVTAAWTIGTETESALKEGNYVQGTVLMVLRKQTSEDVAFLDEIVPLVESEVENQLKAMLALEDREDPNFTDADYQLAAYAAALRVLTQYRGIEDIDVSYELSRDRARGEVSPIAKIIEDAVKTASNFLVPAGLESHFWKKLTAVEKFYLKGLEVESHGDFRSGVYQEFARGFGVRDYQFLLESGKANQTRLKTASELKRRELGGEGFGNALLRQVLFAVYRVAESEETREGMTWLKTEVKDYWAQRENIVALLEYLSRLPIEHWGADAAAARLLAGAVDNDHV
jgi:adenine-specific DNA methylase